MRLHLFAFTSGHRCPTCKIQVSVQALEVAPVNFLALAIASEMDQKERSIQAANDVDGQIRPGALPCENCGNLLVSVPVI